MENDEETPTHKPNRIITVNFSKVELPKTNGNGHHKTNGHCIVEPLGEQELLPQRFRDTLKDWHKEDGFLSLEHAMGYLVWESNIIFGGGPRSENYILKHCRWLDEWKDLKKKKPGQWTLDPNTLMMKVNVGEVCDGNDTETGLLTNTLEGVVQKNVKWLWKNKIPYGYVTVVAGEEGIGKTTLVSGIVAEQTKKGRDVLLIADEDNPEDTLVPRLNAAGADLSRVHHMEEAAWKKDKLEYAFEILRDIGKLEAWLAAHPGVTTVVIDPWLNCAGGINEYSSKQVRQVFMPLQKIARKFGIVIICIAHFKKGQAGRANEKVGGALAVVQVPRSVLLVARVKEEGGVLDGELYQTKHNLNPKENGQKFQIVGAVSKRNGIIVKTSKVMWGGESQRDAEVVFATNDPAELVFDKCCEWLTDFLNDGELPATEVLTSGKKRGFSQRTIFRARTTVAKTRKDEKQNNRAYWSLP
ncbi:MAG: AAA family ATPase [Terriglobales bacterium]|jgi:hypothetical protein